MADSLEYDGDKTSWTQGPWKITTRGGAAPHPLFGHTEGLEPEQNSMDEACIAPSGHEHPHHAGFPGQEYLEEISRKGPHVGRI